MKHFTVLLLFLLVGSFLIIDSSHAQTDTKLTSQVVDLREGPGAYYPLVVRVMESQPVTVLKSEENWSQVRVNAQTGWLPGYLLKSQEAETSSDNKPKRDSPFDRMDKVFGKSSDKTKDSSATASPAEIAAAVKGFSDNYKSRSQGKYPLAARAITPAHNFSLDLRGYRQFLNERGTDIQRRNRHREIKLKKINTPAMNSRVNTIGYAIAQHVARQHGIYEDKELQTYLTYIAQSLVESSHRVELPVQVYVLDSDDVLGYAVPGGYIFMSKGALKSMNNEAHAAHFLAHEIAHLVQGHGEEHYKNNEHVIRKDRAISKLDRLVETDEKHKQTVKDLSVMADRIRDYLNRDELDSYELDADYWGMIYMSRARYHPFESVAYLKQNLIKRGDLPKASKAMWNGAKLETRIKKLEKEIRKQGQYPGNILEDEFLSYQRRLK